MKDIDSFFKEISGLYQSTLPGAVINNFVYFNKTVMFPSKHYRFEIAIDWDEYALLNRKKHHLDYKLLEIFIRYKLCDNKPYITIPEVTRCYALTELALTSCSDENALKIIQEFTTHFDRMLNAWPQELKNKFEEAVSQLSFNQQLTTLISYDCYPYEIVLIAKNRTVHEEVKMFFERKQHPFRSFFHIGTYLSHTFRTTLTLDDYKVSLSLLADLANMLQPFRLRYNFERVKKEEIEPIVPEVSNTPKIVKPQKTLPAGHYSLNFLSNERQRKRPTDPLHPDLAKVPKI